MLCPFYPEKLGVDANTVQHGVEGLMYLLTECSKLMVRVSDSACLGCTALRVPWKYRFGTLLWW